MFGLTWYSGQRVVAAKRAAHRRVRAGRAEEIDPSFLFASRDGGVGCAAADSCGGGGKSIAALLLSAHEAMRKGDRSTASKGSRTGAPIVGKNQPVKANLSN
jgi:hypothetical protein